MIGDDVAVKGEDAVGRREKGLARGAESNGRTVGADRHIETRMAMGWGTGGSCISGETQVRWNLEMKGDEESWGG